MSDLKSELQQLSDMKVSTGNLAVSAVKIMLSLLPTIFACKAVRDVAISSLVTARRAQKQRHFNNLTCDDGYKMVCGTSLGLTWADTCEKLSCTENADVY